MLIVSLVTNAADINFGVIVSSELVLVTDRDLVEFETPAVLTAVTEGAEEPEVH